MKVDEFISKLKLAQQCKTLYVKSSFGSPLTPNNKTRLKKLNSYNTRSDRIGYINNASSDTFGFDCVCLIKGVLWGWSANAAHPYGGAIYKSNDVPDINADSFISKCDKVSSDFSDVKVGEVLWMPGHVGVYVGNGLCIECSPAFKNCVQYTWVNNIKEIKNSNKMNARTWKRHGIIPWVEYNNKIVIKKTEVNIAKEVIAGKWGNGLTRRKKLKEAGWDYKTIQKLVNEMLKKK